MAALRFLSVLSLALCFGSSGIASKLQVSDASGNPLGGVQADFIDAAGAHDVETSDPSGNIRARAGFAPIVVVLTRIGFHRQRVVLITGRNARVTLVRVLPVIGAVSVGTGSPKGQHESPVTTSLLDRAAIALDPGVTTDRVLRELPGFDSVRSNSAFTNYGQLRASFNGAGTDRGVVLVDGFPAQDAFGGQIDWQAYPPGDVERAELLRGAGSALYGSGGIGGVLGLETFAPETGHDAVAGGRVDVQEGTNSSSNLGIQARTPLSPRFGVSLSATAAYFSYRDLPPQYASPIDHPAVASSGTTHVRLRYDDGATRLEGAVRFASDHQYEGRTNYTFDRTFRQGDVIATHRFGPAFARVSYYVRDTTVYNLDDQFPTRPGVLRYIQHVPTDESGFGAFLSASSGITDVAILLDQRRVNGQSIQYGPNGHALQAFGAGTALMQGVGVQATLHGSRFEALLGARADRVRYDDLTLKNAGAEPAQTFPGHQDGAISPRAALRYDLGRRFALRASSGGGFRAPYLNELVRGFNVGPVAMAPNPNLVPERARTDDIGLDALVGAGRLTFDITQIGVADAIAFRTLSPTLMQRANFERTQTNGETLAFSQPVSPCTRLRLSGTSQYARVTSGPTNTVGKRLTLVPERIAEVAVDGAGAGPLGFSADASYAGQTYYDDLNSEPLGPALLFGATFRFVTRSNVTLAVVADNLTDQRYLSSIDRYGEPLTVGLRVTTPLGARSRATSTCNVEIAGVP